MKCFLYILLIISLLFSCRKADDCLSNAGKEIVVESSLNEFDTLFVNDIFTIYLIQDTFNQIRIEGYENFVNSTTFEVKDNSLFLQNEHKCKFSKPNKKDIFVFITINEISRIRLNEASKVISETELNNDSEIGLIINSKYNEADLNLNCKTFYYWNTHLNGGKINLKGKVENLRLWNTSLGSVDASNLSAKNVLVDTDSKADCKVVANSKLDCTIKGQGNVYYSGNPDIIILNDTVSTGKLIYSEKKD
ncbi:MAG: DUF2807 domain-containing protein [Bacteroidales bacterium]|nr:DUF2807 domain-containing protein [Bacteroidales bacterium]